MARAGERARVARKGGQTDGETCTKATFLPAFLLMSNVERGPLPLLLPRRRELPSPRLFDAPGFIYSAELEFLYQLIRQLPTESTKIFTGDKYFGVSDMHNL